MLLLTRAIGEEILLNQGEIKIKIITMINNKVVIGIQAPSQTHVVRKERPIKDKA